MYITFANMCFDLDMFQTKLNLIIVLLPELFPHAGSVWTINYRCSVRLVGKFIRFFWE